MKNKILIMMIITLISTVVIIPHKKADAIGVVGSNAVKSVVIGSMEKAGVQFTSKAAKDKAFDAWNMKAYEKWKADEAAGRNQDLWDAWKSFEANPQKYGKIEPIPDKPGYGKMIIESSIFGLAAVIGWEIGSAIYDSATANPVQDVSYITDNFELMAKNGFETGQFGIRIVSGESIPGGDFKQSSYYVEYNGIREPLTSGTYVTARVTNREVVGTNVNYRVTYVNQFHFNDGTFSHAGGWYKDISIPLSQDIVPEVYEYLAKPLPEHIPTRSPIPELQPLIGPNTDLAVIKEVLPPDIPIEVTVPVFPEADPFWDDVINEPYVPGELPQVPENPENPENPDNPDKPLDPNNPWNPSYPGQPSSPTDPVRPTYPGKDKPIEEKPEYPGETTATETPGLFSKLWEWLKSILDVLFKILSAIVMLPFTLLEMLWDFLIDLATALFVPSDGYWDGNIAKLKKLLWAEEIDELQDGFEDLGGGSGGSFKDVIVDIMGVANVTVIDSDSINSILDTIHKWVRGVIYPLILLFNINSLYKMIRGTSLMEVTRTARYKAGD